MARQFASSCTKYNAINTANTCPVNCVGPHTCLCLACAELMDNQAPVELVRIEGEERVFDREEVLGRDASSVFPTEAEASRKDAAKEMLGSSNRFITESELQAVRAERGASANEGAEVALKPLVEVLREAKEAKEEAFQAVWRSMKTGKNRPLDEDELHFVEKLLDHERQKDQSVREEEKAAMDAFQQAVREAAQRRQRQDESAAAGAVPAQPKPKHAPAPKRKPAVPLVRVKPAKKHTTQQAASNAASDNRLIEGRPAEGQHSDGTAAEKHEGEKAAVGGLGGLIGAYGSGSDQD